MVEIETNDPGTTRPVYRVYALPEGLRAAVGGRRAALGQPVRAFVADAVTHELGPLVRALADLGLAGRPGAGVRPARLPLSAPLLQELRRAATQVGLPSSQLLLLCLARAANRKRRRLGAGPGPAALADATVLKPRGRKASQAGGMKGPGRRRRRGEPSGVSVPAPADPNASNTPED